MRMAPTTEPMTIPAMAPPLKLLLLLLLTGITGELLLEDELEENKLEEDELEEDELDEDEREEEEELEDEELEDDEEGNTGIKPNCCKTLFV